MRVLVLIFFLLSPFVLKAQWEGSTTTDGNTYRQGDVGIGITSPDYPLDIASTNYTVARFQRLGTGGGITIQYQNALGFAWNIGVGAQNAFGIYKNDNSFGSQFIISDNGNIGLGTSTPEAKLHVNTNNYGVRSQYGILVLEGNDAALDIISSSGATWGSAINLIEGNGTSNQDLWSIARQTTNGSGNSSLRINFGVNNHHINNTIATFNANGNIGFGTTSPDYRLDVNGTIRAKEVKVETGWSDFVFDAGYYLRPLYEVESFIQENGHLPDIPSEEEVTKNGISLGEMDSKLLQKIEELTLYVIELKKENDAHADELQELKDKNQELKEIIKSIQN